MGVLGRAVQGGAIGGGVVAEQRGVGGSGGVGGRMGREERRLGMRGVLADHGHGEGGGVRRGCCVG